MSYILDALRKSDQQRQRGAAPTLLTAQATVPVPERTGISMNVWLVAGLVGAGVLIGWLRPWQTESATPMPGHIAAGPTAAKPLAATPVTPPPQADLNSVARESAPDRQPVQASAFVAKPAPAPGSTENDTSQLVGRKVPVTVREDVARPALENPVTETTTSRESGKNVMPLSELPASVRQEIPNLTISFHVYSNNPADRRIMINNELLRQGESLPPGLGVEQITPDGVVISYKGYRFQRGVR
jgi:general secretion pathway protein B